MTDALPFRVCDLCGGVDDHPRHVIAGVAADAHPVDESLEQAVADSLADLVNEGAISMADAMRISGDFHDTTSSDRHKDCCAAAGCPTGTCGPQVQASGGKTGDALRRSIVKNAEG